MKEEINKNLYDTLKKIFDLTVGPFDDPVIDEDLYNEMDNVLREANLKDNETENCRIIQLHSYRIMKPKEIKEMNIKRQGVGVWICENCGDIAHSM